MYYNISTDRSLIINLCIEALNEPMNGGDADLKVIERIINYFGNFKGKLGAKKDGAISALKNHLNNRHKLIRYEAAAALGELDYTNNKNLIMPVFLEALFDVDKDDSISIGARMQILKACRAIGPEAGEALPGLLHVTKDEIKKWGGGLTFLPPISIWTLESVTGLPLSRIIINDVLTYPMVNIFIAFCFCGLFRWSVKLREKGKKVFHWFLPVPVLFYACYCVYNIAAKTNSVFEFMYNYKIFIFLTLVGLIPWLLSWLFCKHSVNPSR
ncbi:MAG: hypothetical protein KKH28_12190 [Elusimicrobia bacterium]|nr:hypothetical protein [Elusimicrobiota bacterium]